MQWNANVDAITRLTPKGQLDKLKGVFVSYIDLLHFALLDNYPQVSKQDPEIFANLLSQIERYLGSVQSPNNKGKARYFRANIT